MQTHTFDYHASLSKINDVFRQEVALSNHSVYPGTIDATTGVLSLERYQRWQLSVLIAGNSLFVSSLHDKGYVELEGAWYVWRILCFSDATRRLPSPEMLDTPNTFRVLKIFTVEEYAQFMILNQPEIFLPRQLGLDYQGPLRKAIAEYLVKTISMPDRWVGIPRTIEWSKTLPDQCTQRLIAQNIRQSYADVHLANLEGLPEGKFTLRKGTKDRKVEWSLNVNFKPQRPIQGVDLLGLTWTFCIQF